MMTDAEKWVLHTRHPDTDERPSAYVATPHGKKPGDMMVILVWTDVAHKEEDARRIVAAVNAMLGAPELPAGSVAKLLAAVKATAVHWDNHDGGDCFLCNPYRAESGAWVHQGFCSVGKCITVLADIGLPAQGD